MKYFAYLALIGTISCTASTTTTAVPLSKKLADNWFPRLDANTDGSISTSEFKAAGRAYNQKMADVQKQWIAMDKDADGTVTKAELKAYFETLYPTAPASKTTTTPASSVAMWHHHADEEVEQWHHHSAMWHHHYYAEEQPEQWHHHAANMWHHHSFY